MLGLMKFKKLFWKKSDEHDKLDELDHEFIAGFTKREIIRMIQNMSDEELEKALAAVNKKSHLRPPDFALFLPYI